MAFQPGKKKAADAEPGGRPLAGPAPNAARLHEAALHHLARFATTETGMFHVLVRRIDRWARRAANEMDAEDIQAATGSAVDAAREVAARLVAAGAIDDAAFAAIRARRLRREGKSARAVDAHLKAKGVDPETARAALPEDEAAELAAAIAAAKRRRIGPFRRGDAPDLAGRMKELATLARNGFTQNVAREALDMDPEAAEAMLIHQRHL